MKFVINGITVEVPIAPSVPRGTVVAWYPQDGINVPDGWAICDGTDGTPDLRGRFILGNGISEEFETSYIAGETGGEEEVTLTKSQLADHTHSVLISNVTGSSTKNIIKAEHGAGSTTSIVTSGVMNNTDEIGQPHNNMPPYYVLVYIMKL